MNFDTINSYQGGTGRNALISQSALGTAETGVLVGTDTGSVTAVLGIPSQSAIIGSSAPQDPNSNASITQDNFGGKASSVRGAGRPYFNSGSFEGRAFKIRLTGKFTTSNLDSATGHAIKLYQSTVTTFPGTALLGSFPSSATLAAGSYNFQVEASLIWDSVSQKLTGIAAGYVGDTYTAPAGIAPIAVISLANLLFTASVKFNNGAANVFTPVEFSIEDV